MAEACSGFKGDNCNIRGIKEISLTTTRENLLKISAADDRSRKPFEEQKDISGRSAQLVSSDDDAGQSLGLRCRA